MRPVLPLAVLTTCLLAPLHAQGRAQYTPLDDVAVKHAGTFHVASGTWSRPRRPRLGPPWITIYANDLHAGAMYTAPEGAEIVDNGRVPSASSNPPNVGSTFCHTVGTLTWGYATSQVSSQAEYSLRFYNDLPWCQPTSSSGFGTVSELHLQGILPGSTVSGVLSAWTVTLDLSNTTLEFDLTTDVDGTFDGGGSEDSFGWSSTFHNVSGGPAGPLVAGSCSAVNPAPGQGTYYNDPSVTGRTGLGTNDFFWIEDTAGTSGCFFFGGCNTVDSNPYASFFMVMDADPASPSCDDQIGESYCFPAPLNSAGGPGLISAQGSTRVVDQDVRLCVEPVPNCAGLFYVGPQQLDRLPWGEGARCVGGPIRRMYPVINASENRACLSVDFLAPYAGDFVSGACFNFQYWFREKPGDWDGDGIDEHWNTSDAIQICFE